MIDVFNNLSILGKCMIIVLIIAFIILIGLVIYLLIKNKKNNDQIVDTSFFDDIKSDINVSKSIENININKDENINTNTSNVNTKIDDSIKKDDKNEKFDISIAAKQMQEDINNNIELTEFEMEQEEKSIISYKELLEKVKQSNVSPDNIKVNIQTVELDNIKDKEEDFNYNTEVLDFSDLNDNKLTENTSTLLKRDDLKEMLNINNINTAVYSSNEFLDALKELRDSLE